MSNLSKIQVIAVKSMARSIVPIQKKLDKLHKEEAAFLMAIALEKAALETQINNANNAIIEYTGGLTAEEVLNPATVIPEATDGSIDETATVDMTEIPTPSVEIPAEELYQQSIAEEGTNTSVVEVEEEMQGSEEEAPALNAEVPFWHNEQLNTVTE